MDDGYVKKLEEELELVTEQLIDTEKRLTDAEALVQEKENQIQSLLSKLDSSISLGRSLYDAIALANTSSRWKSIQPSLRKDPALSRLRPSAIDESSFESND